jgi:hypothetical protein
MARACNVRSDRLRLLDGTRSGLWRRWRGIEACAGNSRPSRIRDMWNVAIFDAETAEMIASGSYDSYDELRDLLIMLSSNGKDGLFWVSLQVPCDAPESQLRAIEALGVARMALPTRPLQGCHLNDRIGGSARGAADWPPMPPDPSGAGTE